MAGPPAALARPALRHIMLLAKDVPAAAAFYSGALGLPLTRLTERWAELDCGGGGVLAVTADADGASGDPAPAAAASRSPFLCFSVRDLQTVVARCLDAGAALDGPIQYPPRGAVREGSEGGEGRGIEGSHHLDPGPVALQVAALRAPDGHLLSLFEPADGG